MWYMHGKRREEIDVFLTLPIELSGLILSSRLGLAYACSLDSAYCKALSRRLFPSTRLIKLRLQMSSSWRDIIELDHYAKYQYGCTYHFRIFTSCDAYCLFQIFGQCDHLDLRQVTFMDNCSNLLNLRLSRNPNDEGVAMIGRACTNLKAFMSPLSLESMIPFSDVDVHALANYWKHLVKISFSGHLQVTDDSILALVGNCPSLEYMVLAGTAVTDEVMVAISNRLPHMEFLNVAIVRGKRM